VFASSGLAAPAFIAFGPLVASAFRVSAVENIGNNLRLIFTSEVGQNHAIQSRADLLSGAWVTLPGTTNSGAGGTVQTPNALAQPHQFYRILQW
jgi:hypothetical protein